MTDYLQERGVCFFAYNNKEIDYVALAVLAAKYVKKHLGLPVCLITDTGSDAWLSQSHNISDIQSAFEYIVITDDEMRPNVRRHHDSPWTEFNAQFSNSNKHKIWEYSPFEQTLLLDLDYIVKTDFLLSAFDNMSGVSMFDRAITIQNQIPGKNERKLYDAGIKMWWSTVVYFDRSDFSELFFNTWDHVADNYEYYQYLYNFPPNLFRTDYCVSIAAHILNGMQDGDSINNFYNIPMINMSQKDDIVDVNDLQDWVFLAANTREPWKNILVKHTNLDIHVMNKRALDRVRPKLLEMFNE